MKEQKTLKTNYFMGCEISDYGKEKGFLDYYTLSRAFDCILNNEIFAELSSAGYYFEYFNGLDNDNDLEIFQYFIVGQSGAELLQEWTDEIVFYCEQLDLYIWGVTHFGTPWGSVLTSVKIELD